MQKSMKILIEHDGSRRAKSAIEDLQIAGLPREVKVKIVSVVEPIIPVCIPEAAWLTVSPQVTEHVIQQSKFAIKAACERLNELFPYWELDYAVYQGKTERGIIELTEKWKPDLVVLGPINRSELGRLIFGSLSRSIVDRSSCSVRVARPIDTQDVTMLRLLIGFDGSAGSAAAVSEVASRCWSRGTQVRIVSGFQSSFVLSRESENIGGSLGHMRLRVAVGMLRAAGLEVSTVIRDGSPRQVILDEAANYGAHSIFIGNGNHSGFRRHIFGSTAATIASNAKCTVEVVRRNERRVIAMYSGAGRRAPRRAEFEAATWALA
jgi:nucleotide-binding universal stress UspA family protein